MQVATSLDNPNFKPSLCNVVKCTFVHSGKKGFKNVCFTPKLSSCAGALPSKCGVSFVRI